jgi:hypothetical protein
MEQKLAKLRSKLLDRAKPFTNVRAFATPSTRLVFIFIAQTGYSDAQKDE